MKNINLAMIGAGGIGHSWATAIAKTRGVHLRAVADLDKKRAQEVAALVPGCRVETNWRAIIADRDIDAVLICTPHKWLASISYAALKAHKHVLCEKPAGVNTKEVEKNIRIAKRNKLVYMVGFNHRYHPAFMKAKEIFEKGGIGKIDFVRARYGFGGRPGYGKEWRLSKRIGGGGELLDQGMHMIDMARWFMGDFTTVHGFAENFFWGGDVEDNGFALMRTAAGQVASVHVSWTNWEWIHSFEIGGTKGYLQIDALDQRYNGPERLEWGVRDKTFARPKKKTFVFTQERKHDSFHRELRAFAAAITGKKKMNIPAGEAALASLRIIEKIYAQQHGTSKK